MWLLKISNDIIRKNSFANFFLDSGVSNNPTGNRRSQQGTTYTSQKNKKYFFGALSNLRFLKYFLLIFRLNFVHWSMTSFLYCNLYSYVSSKYCDSNGCALSLSLRSRKSDRQMKKNKFLYLEFVIDVM